MFQKLLLAACVSVGGALVAAPSTADAGNCYRGRRVVRSGFVARPAVTVARVPAYRYVAPGFRPYPVYRPRYNSYIGPGVGFGSPYRFGNYGYGRGGVSIGIGF